MIGGDIFNLFVIGPFWSVGFFQPFLLLFIFKTAFINRGCQPRIIGYMIRITIFKSIIHTSVSVWQIPLGSTTFLFSFSPFLFSFFHILNFLAQNGRILPVNLPLYNFVESYRFFGLSRRSSSRFSCILVSY